MTPSKQESASLRIRLFGPLDVQVDGQPLPRLRSRKGYWLLALLALRQGREVTRDWLAGTLWPDGSEPEALHSLRISLADLRQALGAQAQRLNASSKRVLCLDLADAEVDVLGFDSAIARGDPVSLEQAAALYRGPLLEDCTEDWAVQERLARELVYLQALQTLAAQAVDAGDSARAVQRLRQVIAIDPLREEAQRKLLEALAAQGDFAAVIQSYRDYRLLLHRELHSEPGPETISLYEHLRALSQQREASSAAARSMAAAGPPPRHLPQPITPLIGREEEVQEVAGYLRQVRLVTLTGSGGVGKTRLAIAVGETVIERFPDGIWLIDLTSLSDPQLVAQITAAVLEVPEEPDQPLPGRLVNALKSKAMLLILDNCEHLLNACAHLIDVLLAGCPHLRVLATSRQPLGLTGELVWRVPSLKLPDQSELASSDEKPGAHLMEYDAVRLFVERGSLVQPKFALTSHNLRTAAQICIHLDGIPLAIELAAARVRALPIDQIDARMNDRFQLLTGGSRTALPRQQTLQAVMDWSYDLLTEAEKSMLQCLSVFMGGWTIDAAEQVCSAAGLQVFRSSGVQEKTKPTVSEDEQPKAESHTLKPEYLNTRTPEHLNSHEVLDLLTSLVDKSLVVYEERDGQARYRMLETVRIYAQQQLNAGENADPVSERHATYFMQLAEQAYPALNGPDMLIWLSRLDSEHDNLRAALAWSLEEGKREEGRGNRTEGEKGRRGERETKQEGKREKGRGKSRETNQSKIENRKSKIVEVGLRLACALFPFWQTRGHISEGRQWFARILARNSDQVSLLRARALNAAGHLARVQKDYEAARALHTEALSLGRALGDQATQATAFNGLGNIAFYLQDIEGARAAYVEMVSLFTELGDKRGLATAYNGLGVLASAVDDVDGQRTYYGHSMALWREIGEWHGLAITLTNLAELERTQKDFAASLRLYLESFDHLEALDARPEIAQALEAIGIIECECSHLDTAVRLFGAGDALREQIDLPRSPSEDSDYRWFVAETQPQLGQDLYNSLWAEGRQLTQEQAIALVRRIGAAGS